MANLIELKGVALRRGRSKILSEIDFQVEAGQNWVVLGPNGAGKTSMARLIAARDYPTSGTATVLGVDTSDAESTYVAARVGVASQDTRERIIDADSVLDVVLSAAWGQTVRFSEEYEDADRERADNLLSALGIGPLSQRSFGSLSEGEKQRVSIARALMADPEIVILDEPTAGLDLGARETLVLALGEIMSGPNAPAVVLITHEIEEIAPGFTHAALMKDGRVAWSGPIDEVLTGAKLTEVFGLPLEVRREDGRWWARAV